MECLLKRLPDIWRIFLGECRQERGKSELYCTILAERKKLYASNSFALAPESQDASSKGSPLNDSMTCRVRKLWTELAFVPGSPQNNVFFEGFQVFTVHGTAEGRTYIFLEKYWFFVFFNKNKNEKIIHPKNKISRKLQNWCCDVGKVPFKYHVILFLLFSEPWR